MDFDGNSTGLLLFLFFFFARIAFLLRIPAALKGIFIAKACAPSLVGNMALS